MSSSIVHTLSRVRSEQQRTTQSHPRIDLEDNTQENSTTQESSTRLLDPNRDGEDDSITEGNLSRQNTSAKQSRLSGFREELANRKYRKYQESRYREDDGDEEVEAGVEAKALKGGIIVESSEMPTDPQTSQTPKRAETTNSRVRRSKQKAEALINRRKAKMAKAKDDSVTAIDILYENQRGYFVFGMPFYSSASLLPLDAPAWQDASGNAASVNVTNAQLPDPSWEWSWKTWYVDMSGDVDEQGWEYSFLFQGRFRWHGTHPFWHSFVRRRRWIRKRERTKMYREKDKEKGKVGLKEAHRLTEDYFTIHPAVVQQQLQRTETASFLGGSSTLVSSALPILPEYDDSTDSIDDIPTLYKRLKTAQVDREKINAVLQYMEQGIDDTYYLADEMPHILSLFIFQHSRRQLVTQMVQKIDSRAPRKPPADNDASKSSRTTTPSPSRQTQTPTSKSPGILTPVLPRTASAHPWTPNPSSALTDVPSTPRITMTPPQPSMPAHTDPSSASKPTADPAAIYSAKDSVGVSSYFSDAGGEIDLESSKARNLTRAVEAADAQIKRLEYWSDIKDIVEQGESLSGASREQGWDSAFSGLGGGGPGRAGGTGADGNDEREPGDGSDFTADDDIDDEGTASPQQAQQSEKSKAKQRLTVDTSLPLGGNPERHRHLSQVVPSPTTSEPEEIESPRRRDRLRKKVGWVEDAEEAKGSASQKGKERESGK